MEKKIIWIVQCYEREMDNNFLDIVVCEVYAKNEEEALKRAGKLIKRKHYRVQRVIEKYETK
jgi:hypothetical protein